MVVVKKPPKKKEKSSLCLTLHNLKDTPHHKRGLLNHDRPGIRADTRPRPRTALAHTQTHLHIQIQVRVRVQIHIHRPRLHKIQTLSLNSILITPAPLLTQCHVHSRGASSDDHQRRAASKDRAGQNAYAALGRGIGDVMAKTMARAVEVDVVVIVVVVVWSRPCVGVDLGVGGGGGGGVEREIEEVVRRHLRWLVTSAECGGG